AGRCSPRVDRMTSTTARPVATGRVLPMPPVATSRAARRARGDRIFRATLRAAAFVLVALVAVMGLTMTVAARPAHRSVRLSVVYTSSWDPVQDEFGALPFIYGTVVSSLLALALAVPLGLGAAVFLAELAPRWARGPVSFLIEILAAIPSVVYGLWGIFI